MSRFEITFSVGLLAGSAIVAIASGWLAIRFSPFFVVGLFLSSFMFGISCIGLGPFLRAPDKIKVFATAVIPFLKG